MRTADGFYREFRNQLALPGYFGQNLNALSECLTDAGILSGGAFVIFFDNGGQLLADESSQMTDGVFDVLTTVGAEWSTPVSEGQNWDREARPFHSIVQCNRRIVTLAGLPNFGA